MIATAPTAMTSAARAATRPITDVLRTAATQPIDLAHLGTEDPRSSMAFGSPAQVRQRTYQGAIRAVKREPTPLEARFRAGWPPVPGAGLEPASSCERRVLSARTLPVCLPGRGRNLSRRPGRKISPRPQLGRCYRVLVTEDRRAGKDPLALRGWKSQHSDTPVGSGCMGGRHCFASSPTSG